MKFLWTNASRNTLNKIKESMLEQYDKKDINMFKLKFTKKKEFLAIPLPYFDCPAFELYINQKLYSVYVFRNDEWSEIE